MSSNVLEVRQVRGVSRLTVCRNEAPVKLINPRSIGGACQVYLSSYGGGMVEGDRIHLDVKCGEGARFFLGSQSSTRIFKSRERKDCLQSTVGAFRAKSFNVICPDPVVPYRHSRFIQYQRWEMDETSDLVLVDCIQSGRKGIGESFQYELFQSHLQIFQSGLPLLSEKFRLTPQGSPESGDGFGPFFGPFDTMMNIYCFGPKARQVAERIAPNLLSLNESFRGGRQGGSFLKPLLSVSTVKETGILIRCLSQDKRPLQPILALLFAELEAPDKLGFDPFRRKF